MASSDPTAQEQGGEMGALIRARDWSRTPLGPMEVWPQSLKVAVRLLLNTRHPMLLWWGPELIHLFNDAYAASLGPEKREALGMRGRDTWAEAWNVVGPQIEQVMGGGEATWHEDQLIPIVSHGARQPVWWTYGISPIDDPDAPNGVGGVLAICRETTREVLARRETDERYRTLFESVESGFCVVEVDPGAPGGRTDYRVVEANPAFYRQTGFPEAVLGRWLREAAPELEEHWYETYGRVARTGAPERFEQGSEALGRWFDVNAFRIGAAEERRVAILFTDISARRNAELALRESEARFRNMADHAPVMVWTTDPDGRCTYLNRAWYEFTGQAEDEALGFGWLDATHPDDKPEAERVFLQANAAGGEFRVEYRLRRRDGTYRWAIDAAAPRFDADGAFLGYVGSVIDIDDRREAEARLRESEARYRTLFDTMDEGFCVIEFIDGPDGPLSDYVHVQANPAYTTNAGVPDIVGKRLREFVSPSEADAWAEIYRRVLVTGEPVRFERELVETGRHLELAAFRVEPESRREVAVLFQDVTPRRRAEKALRELNETLEQRIEAALAERKLLADIVEGTDAFVQVADLDHRWLAINKAAAGEFERIFGVRPQAGDRMTDLLADQPEHQAAVRRVWDRALAGEAYTEMAEFGDPALDRRFYEMRFNPLHDADGRRIGAYQFVYDVTERMREQARLAEIEEALRQAQKMEAIGQLTGGVAHDFNNLLTVIRSSADLLRRRELPEDRRRRYVDAISDTADRAARLTGQLLAFSRRQALTPETFDASARVEGVAEMLRTLVGDRVELVVEPRCAPCFVEADANQFETALVNMAVNARDAMDGEGRIVVAVDKAASMPALRGHAGSDLPFVAVSVSDTGSGIAPDDLQRIFEPFFTTKEVGRGTGLGLSQIYGFAKQSGGDVAVESRPGEGATFTLYLPHADAPEEIAMDEHAIQPAPADQGRVLVVEDNADVGEFATRLLEDLGYRTELTSSAAEALALLEDGDAPFDLVFSDVVMPGMDGVTLGRRIRERRPDLPVVLTSGYSHALADDARHGFALLRKPYSVEELARVLRDARAGRS